MTTVKDKSILEEVERENREKKQLTESLSEFRKKYTRYLKSQNRFVSYDEEIGNLTPTVY